MTVETKNDEPTSAEVINWATVFGIALALGILAMSVGLIRSETAADLRTLAATGASSSTRRTITGATAGALALLGAVLGTVAGYVAAAAWFQGSAVNGGLSALSNVPSGEPADHRRRHAAGRGRRRVAPRRARAADDRPAADGLSRAVLHRAERRDVVP